ncbi:MAG: hypothetical protein AAB215_01950, partial [Planctomycetota bacterium]
LQDASRRVIQKFVKSESFEILLSDLQSEQGLKNQRAFGILSALSEEGAPALSLFIQETEDFRARKIAATALREMSPAAAAGLTRHLSPMGNPAPARRIAGLLETLSSDLEADLARALESRHPEVRGEAIRVLARQAPDRRARVLAPLIGHESPGIARNAVFYAGEWGVMETVPKMLDILARPETDPALVREACITLGRLSAESAVEILSNFLKARKSMGFSPRHPSEIRAAAAWALAQIPSEAAQQAVQAAQSDRDPNVRSAAQATSGSGGPA